MWIYILSFCSLVRENGLKIGFRIVLTRMYKNGWIKSCNFVFMFAWWVYSCTFSLLKKIIVTLKSKTIHFTNAITVQALQFSVFCFHTLYYANFIVLFNLRFDSIGLFYIILVDYNLIESDSLLKFGFINKMYRFKKLLPAFVWEERKCSHSV